MFISVERAFNLGSVHFKLFKSSSSKRVSTNQANSPSSLHVLVSEFGTSSGFTRALQTNKHDDIGFASLELVWLVFRAQHFGEFINDNSDDFSS
jgi:hypothetical protein